MHIAMTSALSNPVQALDESLETTAITMPTVACLISQNFKKDGAFAMSTAETMDLVSLTESLVPTSHGEL